MIILLEYPDGDPYELGILINWSEGRASDERESFHSNNNNNNDKVMFLYLFNCLVIILEFYVLLVQVYIALLESIFRRVFPLARKSVDGQIILITGAGHGLGKELAVRFSKLGAVLVLWDIDKERCDRTAKDIKNLGGRAYSYHVDVSDVSRVMAAAEKVKEEVGKPDIVINNAAIVKVQPFLDVTASSVRKTVNVNLLSHFWTIKSFLPDMIHSGRGHIVAISSNLGMAGKSHFVDYCASKFGVNGLMAALGAELHQMKKSKGITLTTVCPAAINTGLVNAIETRFPRIFPLLETSSAAAQIVDSILRNDSLLVLPWGYRYLYAFLRNMPHKVSHLMEDYLGNTTEID